jgi:hypothetical protein
MLIADNPNHNKKHKEKGQKSLAKRSMLWETGGGNTYLGCQFNKAGDSLRSQKQHDTYMRPQKKICP